MDNAQFFMVYYPQKRKGGKALELFDLTPRTETAILAAVDAGEYDMECALAAGVDSGFAAWGSSVDPKDVKSTYVLQTLEDVLKLFEV